MSDQPTRREVEDALEDAYTDEGKRIWWDAWDSADPERRASMERIICTESGGT
jgi:hypothetical protein